MPFLFGVLAGIVVAMTTRGSVVAALFAFLFAMAVTYLGLPVLAPNFASPWMVTVIALAVSGFVVLWMPAGRDRKTTGVRPAITTMAAAVVILAVLAVVSFVSTASIFHAASYASLIGPVVTLPFTKAVQRLDTTGQVLASDRTVIDQASVRLVDSEIAERRAQELLGGDPEFGGTYVLGTMQLTRREGRLVFAAPLEFTGLFEWRASAGAPAYVWVDAHDPRQAGLVKQVDGKARQAALHRERVFRQQFAASGVGQRPPGRARRIILSRSGRVAAPTTPSPPMTMQSASAAARRQASSWSIRRPARRSSMD